MLVLRGHIQTTAHELSKVVSPLVVPRAFRLAWQGLLEANNQVNVVLIGPSLQQTLLRVSKGLGWCWDWSGVE